MALKATAKKPAETRATGGRNIERTRDLILRIATKEFASRGFDGARVDRISARCRLSKNTLYYHFKSKDGLIIAVIERMYEALRTRQAEPEVASLEPDAALAAIVGHTFRAFVENPDIIRILNEENLHKAVHLKKGRFLRELYDPLFEKLTEVLEAGAKSGAFRQGLDPVYVYISMSSMAYHFISNRFTLEIALDRDLSSDEAIHDWRVHITDVILTYCRSGAKQPRTARKTPAAVKA